MTAYVLHGVRTAAAKGNVKIERNVGIPNDFKNKRNVSREENIHKAEHVNSEFRGYAERNGCK